MRAFRVLVTFWMLSGLAGCSLQHTPAQIGPVVTLGGRVSGLLGHGLTLRNQAGEELAISNDGPFSFKTRVELGADYEITVASQPVSPAQTCVVSAGSGSAHVNIDSVAVICTTNELSVSVTVAGLAGSGLVLQNNSTDDLTIDQAGVYTFATGVPSGSGFDVSVKTQPSMPSQTCHVRGGSGTLEAEDVTTVVVECASDRFHVSGEVSGLAAPMVLENNGGDAIRVTANGGFAFPTAVESGAGYAVSVRTQPTSPSQTCQVTQGTGEMGNTDVSDVRVVCATDRFNVGGRVTGLAGSGLVLQNDGGDPLALAANGAFTFASKVESGASYQVRVLAQPTDPTQVCDVAAGEGAVTSADVRSIQVTCRTRSFAIGGTVHGLAGSGLVLQNSDGSELAIDADGTFNFAAEVASGAEYAVTIKSQPSGPAQTCTVSGGTGTVGAGAVTSVVVDCALDRFTVGGSVSGLAGTLVLQNNAGDDLTLTANGEFAFSTPVASGHSFAVTVLTQPTTPSQVCTIAGGTGAVGGADVTSVVITCATNAYAIGGSVSGLSGKGLVLRNNAGDDLEIDEDGSFTFPTPVASGAAYEVSVRMQPTAPAQTCALSHATGLVTNSPVTSVVVTCTSDTYTVGGTVTGLAGDVLTLRNNGVDDVHITTNGSFTFPGRIASGGSYAVSVIGKPKTPSQTCVVSMGSGPVTDQNVQSVAVSCTTDKFRIGGTVSGLKGEGLVLQQNGGDDLPIDEDGSFTFATPIESCKTFNVTVADQPSRPTQTCTVSGGSGTACAGHVTSVTVNCAPNKHTIGGQVRGLVGTGLVLRNSRGDDLAIGANGSFAFSTPLVSGSMYDVSVASAPTAPWQTCVVTAGSGRVSGADVTSVDIACAVNTYTISGTLSGLPAGAPLVVRNNNADELSLTANGAFSFAIPIASGSVYSVRVISHGSDSVCSVNHGTGVVGGSAVSDVSVSCNGFTTRTFTHCAAVGRAGPSQSACDAAYASSALAGEVTVSSGIQEWTVPYTGTYRIEAFGAQGVSAQAGYSGGLGARIRGDFALVAGQRLRILVGQQGLGEHSGTNGGGGGGSFVVLSDGTPLVVAGGGGGARVAAQRDGFDASIGVNGVGGRNSSTGTSGGVCPGGTDGDGGELCYSWGSGGGGFYGNGADDSTWGTGGQAFIHGGLGGAAGASASSCGIDAEGGFGGGGAGNGCLGGGGGGGYSGGGGGYIAGGGGSFNSGENQSNSAGARTGAGLVTITAAL